MPGILRSRRLGLGRFSADSPLSRYIANTLPGVPSDRRTAVANAATTSASGQDYSAESVIDTLAICRNWFAFDIASCFQDSAGTIPCSGAGQPIGRIVPWVGSAPATQATTANKPTTGSGGAIFQTDDWLDAGSSINPMGSAFTIFTNAIASNTTTPGTVCARDNSASRGFVLFRTTTGGLFETGGTVGTSYTAANNTVVAVTGGIQIYVDGALNATQARTIPTNTNTFAIGRRNFTGVENYLNGTLWDLIVKDDAAYSATDRAKIERFLKFLRA